MTDYSPPASTVFESTQVEGLYTQNTQHAEEIVDRLIEFFRQPRNQAILEAIAAQIQELEDETYATYGAFDLETATGHQLKLLGKLVGELPDGRTDDAFRAAIRVRILVNNSDGTLPQLAEIAGDIVKSVTPAATVRIQEFFPASLLVEWTDLGDATLAQAYRLIKQAAPAGVRVMASEGAGHVGDTDGTPAGGIIGDTDGDPLGFVIADGT